MSTRIKGKAVCQYCLTAFDPNDGHDCPEPYVLPSDPTDLPYGPPCPTCGTALRVYEVSVDVVDELFGYYDPATKKFETVESKTRDSGRIDRHEYYCDQCQASKFSDDTEVQWA